MVEKMTAKLNSFLFSYLRDKGVKHIFGIPGDYILPLYKALEETEGIDYVVATHEPNAAFSADAYGRTSGLGVMLVTYGVGGFNAMNGVAGAYTEQSPLLIISGGPPTNKIESESVFSAQAHHIVNSTTSQLDAFRNVTDLVLRIESPEEASEKINLAAEHAMQKRLPVYLEIPTDLMNAEIPVKSSFISNKKSDSTSIEKATKHFIERINKAQRPVIYAGIETSRYRLQDAIRTISLKKNIPIVTSILGKGVINESDPNLLGLYAGVLSQSNEIRDYVENSDLVIMVGVKITDVNCGAFTADLNRENLLIAKSDYIGDSYQKFTNNIHLKDFITSLAGKLEESDLAKQIPSFNKQDFSDSKFIIDRYFSIIEKYIDNNHVIVADTGDSCYGSLFIKTKRDNGYIAPTFYNTMGFSVPAALGIQLADPTTRPIVLVGDGAFQMTGTEFTNMIRQGLNPIVILLNNDGFGMQRIFVDGNFNDINTWDYSHITSLMSGGEYFRAETDDQFQTALLESLKITDKPVLLEAMIPKGEISSGMQLMKKALMREKTGICPLNEDGIDCGLEESCSFCRASIWQ
jgi:TPP-dependent 2-oxoacid decarboxylase